MCDACRAEQEPATQTALTRYVVCACLTRRYTQCTLSCGIYRIVFVWAGRHTTPRSGVKICCGVAACAVCCCDITRLTVAITRETTHIHLIIATGIITLADTRAFLEYCVGGYARIGVAVEAGCARTVTAVCAFWIPGVGCALLDQIVSGGICAYGKTISCVDFSSCEGQKNRKTAICRGGYPDEAISGEGAASARRNR